MDPELRGHLEVAADEWIEETIIDIALVETDEDPVSTDYVLGMLEVALIGTLDVHLSQEEYKNMDENAEELVGEIRKIVHRREDDIRAALNRRERGSLGDGDTQIFDA